MLLSIGLVALGLLLHGVAGHMQMHSPIPRGDPRNKEYGESTTLLSAPLNGRKNPGKFPCRYQKEGPITAKYTAGKNFTVEFMQGSPHMGGHCQFAFSYDNGKTWVVLRTIIDMCFEGKAPYTYSVALPKGARNGRGLLGWAYINAGGNLEYYMNCADVEVSGGSDEGSLTGPELLVARMPGTVQIGRWANKENVAELDGREHFVERKIVTIPVGAQPTDNGTVVGEPGGGKEGVEQPPATIPWDSFIDSKFVAYGKSDKLAGGLGKDDNSNAFYISTSDNPRGCSGADGKDCPATGGTDEAASTKRGGPDDSYDEPREKKSKRNKPKQDEY